MSEVRKKPGPKPRTAGRVKFEFMAEPRLVARAERQAARLDMSVGSYVRMSLTHRVEADEATDPNRRSGS